jgi:serine phosphatase RsbU (regulator of sigma subunit)
VQEELVQLYPGDRVINYTDGIPEAMSPKNEEFGEERFYKLVEKTTDKTCNQFCSILVQAIEKWAAGGEQHDDITIVALSVS